jgi:2-aminoadipate transaminase
VARAPAFCGADGGSPRSIVLQISTSPLSAGALTIPRIEAAASARGPGLISFAGGTAHPSDLPRERLREAIDASITPQALAYGPARGQPALLSALRDYLASTEGVEVGPERMMVTSGAMSGIDLVFRRLLRPGDVAVVESPTYGDALISLALSAARVLELPMDDEGARVEELPGLIDAEGAPRLIYVIPDFHNPTGVTLSGERRRRLVAAAAEHGAILVEDDAYGAFRFAGDPRPSLLSLSDEVVAIRSLSKVVAPGLRVGCVIGPPDLVERLAQVRGGTDICTSPLIQETVARFIAEGEVDRQIERLRRLFSARRDAMLEALSTHVSDLGAEWSTPEGGMFIWLRLPEGVDTVALLDHALDAGVAFVPGSVFSLGGGHRSALRLCFASVDSESIEEGVARMRRAFERLPAAG